MTAAGRRPVIGISVGSGIGWCEHGPSYEPYARAVRDAGADPVQAGLRGKPDLSSCDGLLLSGGLDVHPRHYDPPPGSESLTPELFVERFRIETDELRDESEFALIDEAIRSGKPILAICRGIQVLNVFLGRKLLPDIALCLPGALIHHSPPTPAPSRTHGVSIMPGTLLEQIYGSLDLVVNSRHHQGITAEMVPDGLRVAAVSPDGVVEAVEGVNHRFIVGVQWHPERRADAHIFARSRPLFEAFVSACRKE